MEFKPAAGIPEAVERFAGEQVYCWAVENGGADGDLAILAARLVSERALPAWARLKRALEDAGRNSENVAASLGIVVKMVIWARLQRAEKPAELKAELRKLTVDSTNFRGEAEAYEAIGDARSAKIVRDHLDLVTERLNAINQQLSDGTFVIKRDRDNQKAGGKPGHRREIRSFVRALQYQFELWLHEPLHEVVACFTNTLFDTNLTSQQVIDMTRRPAVKAPSRLS
jgi:hypothetical protein